MITTREFFENDADNIILDLENKGYNKTYHIQNFRNDDKSTLKNIGYVMTKMKHY